MSKPNINLFIVGAAKSGTTSLYYYLKQHPDVFFSKVKEPNFYSDINSENPEVYKKPQPNKFYHHKIINDKDDYFKLFEGSENFQIIGDSSPSYLWDKNSAKKIYDDFPHAKILIILRNPIERAFSHYLMNIRTGLEKEKDFYTALLRDEKITHKRWGDGKSMLYVSLGMYSNQVKNFYDYFENENIKVVIYEEFFKDVEKGIKRLFDFLDTSYIQNQNLNLDNKYNSYKAPKNKVAEFFIKRKQKLNFINKITPDIIKNLVLFKESKKPKIDDKSYNYLSQIFKQDKKKLELIIGKKIDIWS